MLSPELGGDMERRKFITLLSGTSFFLSLPARAQQSAMPVIGFLGLTSPEAFAPLTAAFQRGLSETGFAEGQNVAIVYHWAHGQFDQLPALASDLVRQRLSVFAAMVTPASALAAEAATTMIPIVFVTGRDPVGVGLVDSLSRPSGNATTPRMVAFGTSSFITSRRFGSSATVESSATRGARPPTDKVHG